MDRDLDAYRGFPGWFVEGRQEPLFPPLDVQLLSRAYERLGYDPASRTMGDVFEDSPLWCNGRWNEIAVNRYCLLDEVEEAFRRTRHFPDGHKDEAGSYAGPAEPGPYFVVEVLRRRFA